MARKELALKVEQKYESTLRIAYHALRTLPGVYVTSPLGINLWLNAGKRKGWDRIGYWYPELWFRTEEDRRNAILAISEDRLLHHYVRAIHAEVGEPEDILPQHTGFIAECLWFELNKEGRLCIYGTPEALRDSKERILNLNTGAEPLMSFLSSARWQGILSEFKDEGLAFRLSEESIEKIIRATQEHSYGFPVPVEEMRNSMGIVTGQRSLLLNEGFQLMREHAPASAILPATSSLLKHTMRYDENIPNLVIIDSCFRRSGEELHDKLASWEMSDLAPRAKDCTKGITAYEDEPSWKVELASLFFRTDLLCEILEKCKGDKDDTRRVFEFIEGVASLPDDDKPSMWDIYTSWKNGCEHWDLGPVLAAPLIERSTASLLPHEGCRRSTLQNCRKILNNDKLSAKDVFALVQKNPSLAFLPTEEARIVAKEMQKPPQA